MSHSVVHSIWVTLLYRQRVLMQCCYSALNPIGVGNSIYETCVLGCGKVLTEGFFLFRL